MQGWIYVLVSPGICLGFRSGLDSTTTSLSGTCLRSQTWWTAAVATSSLTIKLNICFRYILTRWSGLGNQFPSLSGTRPRSQMTLCRSHALTLQSEAIYNSDQWERVLAVELHRTDWQFFTLSLPTVIWNWLGLCWCLSFERSSFHHYVDTTTYVM